MMNINIRKDRRLRFIPMAIAFLGGFFLTGPAFAPQAKYVAGFRTSLEFFLDSFVGNGVAPSPLLLAVYIPAAAYCYVAAFPFDELCPSGIGKARRTLRCALAVISSLVADVWIWGLMYLDYISIRSLTKGSSFVFTALCCVLIWSAVCSHYYPWRWILVYMKDEALLEKISVEDTKALMISTVFALLLWLGGLLIGA